jgi:hypothetical protein
MSASKSKQILYSFIYSVGLAIFIYVFMLWLILMSRPEFAPRVPPTFLEGLALLTYIFFQLKFLGQISGGSTTTKKQNTSNEETNLDVDLGLETGSEDPFDDEFLEEEEEEDGDDEWEKLREKAGIKDPPDPDFEK